MMLQGYAWEAYRLSIGHEDSTSNLVQTSSSHCDRNQITRSKYMIKILLVEDNEMNRDMLSRRLERKDYGPHCGGRSGGRQHGELGVT